LYEFEIVRKTIYENITSAKKRRIGFAWYISKSHEDRREKKAEDK
jgi:hypothetical protein